MTFRNDFWPNTTPLPSPLSVQQNFPIDPISSKAIERKRKQIEQILDGVDNRLLIIVGPCSIHNVESALEYADRLKKLKERVCATCFIAMRTYFEKPRTTLGWPGLIYDPNLDETCDIVAGILQSRKLLIELANRTIPTATEFLTPAAALYYGDLLSWGCIGARTVCSQPHRQLASSLPMPVGFKNSTDGNINNAIQAILTAREGHKFFALDQHGQLAAIESIGNPYGHLILRGGTTHTNYNADAVADAMQAMLEKRLKPRIMIDCSHDNSRKVAERQPAVFQDVIEQIINGNQSIIGAMIESNLEAGKTEQNTDPSYGLSITDSCIDWQTTEEMILWAHEKLSLQKGCGKWAQKL